MTLFKPITIPLAALALAAASFAAPAPARADADHAARFILGTAAFAAVLSTLDRDHRPDRGHVRRAGVRNPPGRKVAAGGRGGSDGRQRGNRQSFHRGVVGQRGAIAPRCC